MSLYQKVLIQSLGVSLYQKVLIQSLGVSLYQKVLIQSLGVSLYQKVLIQSLGVSLYQKVLIQSLRQIIIGEKLITIEITTEMVKNKLLKLKDNKPPGPDEIHPYFIKKLANCVSDPITTIINKSWIQERIQFNGRGYSLQQFFKKVSVTIQ